jgi:competence protein CoiA
MKFALVNGEKAEAIKGMKGRCPNCGSEVIAKCGDFKIDHWAHKSIHNCDTWWESETEWHRQWKSNYLPEWQEVSLFNKITNEKHIADVRTGEGLIIEFQHSFIKPNERIAREQFYKNMVWVVDGSRLKRDYLRFINATSSFRQTHNLRIFYVEYLANCFPSNWIESSVPVIFDFRGTQVIADYKDPRNKLFCLLPKKNGRYAVLVMLVRQSFIDITVNGQWPLVLKTFI